MTNNCEHKFIYGGIKYEDVHYSNPGTGARPREYFDWFYCEKCSEYKYHKLAFSNTTYEKVLFGATPKP